ncbi:HpcH/HpaI aldolase/citrate lyase family protein [Tessaracoccus antarcticus]|uniref:CoA ester lyase n=1 Tax=Tessaracoccus antarcticus TaxID=2479848 RepID=A0A3M0GAP4_9ACTN|nr:CoA ester lyase [Tessaracoccus antarcticus]RMB61367.1 CoA ester lyase [Tessaracoccus antarcticus]
MKPALTLLYAPADRPALVAKAFASRADVVLVDLEDAVAAGGKGDARQGLPELMESLLAQHPGRRVQVRINSIGTTWFDEDLAMVARLDRCVAVRLPKVESDEDVRTVADVVGDRAIHALLESALGIEHAFRIAMAGVASIGLGEADLKSSLGVDDDDGLGWARSRLVNAARAAGLGAPAMSAFTNLAEQHALEQSCRDGRRLGFVGRVAIHPKQLVVIEQAFLPSPEQLERAEEVLASIAGATAAGHGVVVLADGRFLDAAMVRRAEETVALADRLT